MVKRWTSTLNLSVTEMGYKAVVTREVLEVTVRLVIALEVVCSANMNRPRDVARDIAEGQRDWNTQQIDVVNKALQA